MITALSTIALLWLRCKTHLLQECKKTHYVYGPTIGFMIDISAVMLFQTSTALAMMLLFLGALLIMIPTVLAMTLLLARFIGLI
jgi:hypothetical protein